MFTMFQNATLKLTLWYMVIITTICLGFSVAIYHFANTALQYGLHSQSTRILDRYPGFDFEPVLSPDDDLTGGSHRILLNLVYFNAIVLTVSGFLSYALARRTLRPIETSHEQQKRFTADVSHELRTPLTAIKMSSEVALMDKSSAKAELREALQSNVEEADKLEQLVNTLLDLTKLEDDDIQHHFAPVDMDAVVEAALDTTQTIAKEKAIALTSSTQPATVQGDQGSLTQIVTILLNNAIKYSPHGSTVKVSSAVDGSVFVLNVHDQGSGIDPEALQHVFDRFYRADKARTSGTTPGYGLGLSIAKRLADLHGATITLSSAVGHGTTATLRLPLEA